MVKGSDVGFAGTHDWRAWHFQKKVDTKPLVLDAVTTSSGLALLITHIVLVLLGFFEIFHLDADLQTR